MGTDVFTLTRDGHVPPRSRHLPLLRRVRAHRAGKYTFTVHFNAQDGTYETAGKPQTMDIAASTASVFLGPRRRGQGQAGVLVFGWSSSTGRERCGPRRVHRAAGQALPPAASGRGPHRRRGEARSSEEHGREKSRAPLRRGTRRVHRQLQRHRVRRSSLVVLLYGKQIKMGTDYRHDVTVGDASTGAQSPPANPSAGKVPWCRGSKTSVTVHARRRFR